MDKRLKTTGGISPELMEEAKAAMLATNMDFSEPTPPSARSGAGYPSLGGYIETHFDFTTCQRADGSYYGTGGTCRKGSPVSGGVPKDAKKSKASASKGGGDAVAPAPPKTTKKDPVANVQKQQKENAALKKSMDKDVTALAKAGKIKGVSAADVERIQARKAEAKRQKDLGAEQRAVKKQYGATVKEADKRAKDLNKEADRLEKGLKKQAAATEKNPTKENKARLKEMRAQTRAADKAAKEADRKADKLDKEYKKALDKVNKKFATKEEKDQDKFWKQLKKEMG